MTKTSKIYKVSNEIARKELVECIKKCNIEQEKHRLKIPSHRKHKFISFEDYKEKILNGRFAKEIKKDTSKHLISFYNYFLKNQSTILTKEAFELEYNKTLNGLDDISKKYNIPREHITYLRDFYGIKRKGATFVRRVTNEQPLSEEAKEIIIGSMLGDGHIGNWCYFSEKHSEKQIQYLEWKASFLTPVLNKNSFRCNKEVDKRSKTEVYSFSIRTIVHDFLIEIHKKFYKKNELGKWIKIVPDDIENILTERVLAVWFMDDGSTSWPFRNGIRVSPNASFQCKISSESFTYKENMLLQKVLLNKFGLIANIRQRGTNHSKSYLRFDCPSSRKMVEMLKKYTTPDLLYKFNENAYLKHVLYLKQIHQNIPAKNLLLEDFKKRHNC